MEEKKYPNVIKRSGVEVEFDITKIVNAISKANKEVDPIHQLNEFQIKAIAENVANQCALQLHAVEIEEIQDMVETGIMEMRGYEVAQKYVRYRYMKNLGRHANTTDDEILALVNGTNEVVKQENSNKNPTIASTQRDYIAGQVSRDISERILLPQDIVAAHRAGIIHVHDTDYMIQRIFNCCLINIKEMLQYGTCISGTKIVKPHSFQTAANVCTQIIAQVASNQFGGQTFSLAHLAPFVDVSRQRIRNEVKQEMADGGFNLTDEQIEGVVKSRLAKEIKAGVQTIQYQIVTLMTTNGQTPFVSMCMYLDEAEEGRERDDLALLIEEVLKQRIQGLPNEDGIFVTPTFPKLLYVLDENNAREDTKYWHLTELAAKCTAKRMVPDYISAKKMKEFKGDVYPCMGCRSFLTPDRFTDKGIGNIANLHTYVEGQHQYYGRFNQGVVTINLPYIACLSNGDESEFWKILDDYLEMCHRALRIRHERLLGVPAGSNPIAFCHGALARLKIDEPIDRLLYHGYSTISLGYAGLYECCMRMMNKSHTDPEAKPFAIAVMQRLNDKCAEWKAAEDIDYSVYGTPIESTTYKFAKALQRDFGQIKDVSDHNYVTNSYHVVVREKIDAFSKLAFEADFQKLSPGGAISYVEVPNMQNNIPAVLEVIKFIYDTIIYAELNTKSDYCSNCGYEGEIIIKSDDTGKLIWECPNCGCRDERKMRVVRRTCGYLGSNYYNQGRTQEIKERVLHL